VPNHRIVFAHFIRQPPLTWKRQGGAGKFRWSDRKLLQKAKENLGWEIKAAEPKLRVNACARFGYRAEFRIWNRADGDNLEKLLMDALQGIVWVNDEQVDEGYWVKEIVVTNPGIKLLIYEIEP
jgi:Holliday junction resolvase RusA-like endonuclease